MARDSTLGGSRLFEGLTDDELEVVAGRMRARQFAPGEQLCAAGDPSDRIWVITGGLVIWTAGTTAGGGEIELRMRKGDVIGAQDAITGTERTATVVGEHDHRHAGARRRPTCSSSPRSSPASSST